MKGIAQRLRERKEKIADMWRTSLQIRVISTIFILSAVVMLILGFALASIFSQRLVSTKKDVAHNEIERARAIVEQQVNTLGTSSSLQGRLNTAQAALAQSSGQSSEVSSAFEPVLLVEQSNNDVVTAPENYQIPVQLRRFVDEGLIANQFAETQRADGSTYKALIVGTPTDADIPGLQVYLVMSMEAEENTLAIVRGLLVLAAGIVVVLLVAVVWLATQQVTGPVRSASRIAQRLAQGHLRERMVVDGEDEMARLALSFNDMADKLSHQIRQLEEYGDLQRQFTSDVSHELRTPLTTVRMAADMIAAEADEFEPPTQRAIELMIRELDRFEELLGDLLEISRHDAGVADLAASEVDLRSCIEAAWAPVKHVATQVKAEVEFVGMEEPVWITADSRRIERVLRNLIANALDHSEGQTITVRLAKNDTSAAITVTDHGVGLKKGQEELVFNRFWRADSSRKRHSGGTGLGLAIAQEDVLLHGGLLDAAGTFGVGSQFRMVLPLTPRATIVEPALDLEAPVAEVIDDEGEEPDDDAED